MGHALPLLERMSQPSDIAIVNFGAWHGSGDGVDYQKLVREFAEAVAEKRERLPHFVWKEMVPTHYDQQHGLYPGEPSILSGDALIYCCPVLLQLGGSCLDEF